MVGRRAKIWLATISTVVGVATGMFTPRDQVFPSEAGSTGAMSTSASGQRGRQIRSSPRRLRVNTPASGATIRG